MARTPKPQKAQSIDGAASGFVRHRFVLALTASWLVIFSFAFAIGGIGSWWALFTSGEGGVGGTIFYFLFGIPLYLFIYWLMMTFGVGIAAAIIQSTHRRIIALLLAAGSGALAFLMGQQLFVILQGIAADRAASFLAQSIPDRVTAASIIAFDFFGALISFECFLQAFWQLTASSEGFLAARGWRPRPWGMAGAFARLLGRPGFVAKFERGRTRLTLLYLLVALLNLGVVALLLLPLFVQTDDNGRLYAASGLIVVAALLLLNLFGAGEFLSRRAEKFATKMYQSVREWDARAPIIFLRAFNQDDDRLPAVGGDPLAKWPAGVGRKRTLDEILLEHATPYGPVLAIGDPRDPTPPLGAARIFVPGEGAGWQDVVKGLVNASKAIVMCPNDSEGVKWELSLIDQVDDWLCVIYLANPELAREANVALFESLAPQGEARAVKRGQTPIAAFMDSKRGWRVLTAHRPSVEAYTIALNTALQARFGLEGVRLAKPA